MANAWNGRRVYCDFSIVPRDSQFAGSSLGCRNHGLRVHRPTVTTVTPRTYSTIYVIQPPSSLSAPIPPPAAHDRQDAASHTCRPRRYPGVLAQLERDPPVDPTYRRPRRPFPEPSSCTDEGSYISGVLLMGLLYLLPFPYISPRDTLTCSPPSAVPAE